MTVPMWFGVCLYILGFLTYMIMSSDDSGGEIDPLWTRFWTAVTWPCWLLGAFPFALLFVAMMLVERKED